MTTMSGQMPERLPVKYLPKAMLGLVMETLLSGDTTGGVVRVSSPWDVWWVAYRAALPRTDFGVDAVVLDRACDGCRSDALGLAAGLPPWHPVIGESRPCGCLLEWAVRMRRPAGTMPWPPLMLTSAMLKPAAPWARIRAELERTHEVLHTFGRGLTTEDTRRLYPEAYGAAYVAARDSYLTGAPVQVLLLRARDPLTDQGLAGPVKARIRAAIGADELRNHLHMPDNPGEALADIAHLAGEETLAELYERYERDRAADRLAFYRAALGIRGTDPNRVGHITGRGQSCPSR